MSRTVDRPAAKHISRVRIAILLIAVLVLYAVLPKIGQFHDSFHIIGGAQWSWLGVAAGAMACTYLAAAGVYVFLARKSLRFGRTVIVQIASMFANRLLPAGIGAIGVNYRYLHRNKHTKTEAAAIVAINNVLGLIGNLILLVILFFSGSGGQIRSHLPVHTTATIYWVTGIVIVVLVLILAWWSKFRQRLAKNALQLAKDVALYRHHLLRLLAALVCSMALTALYAITLYASAHAVGLDFSFARVFVIMSAGVAGATVVPTPGGLGAAEAVLVGGFVADGTSASLALAAVLLYRLFTYWLALLVGGGAFAFSERRKYI